MFSQTPGFSFDGRNQRNVADRPPYWSDQIDRETRGWEFELTANPLRGLRVTANFATADAAQVNAYRQTRAWVDENDALTPVYRGSFYTSTMTVSYPFDLQNGNRVLVNLSIDNLFNFKQPLYYNTRMRPPEGDITSPARVVTPNGFFYQLPINFRLSVRYDF